MIPGPVVARKLVKKNRGDISSAAEEAQVLSETDTCLRQYWTNIHRILLGWVTIQQEAISETD